MFARTLLALSIAAGLVFGGLAAPASAAVGDPVDLYYIDAPKTASLKSSGCWYLPVTYKYKVADSVKSWSSTVQTREGHRSWVELIFDWDALPEYRPWGTAYQVERPYFYCPSDSANITLGGAWNEADNDTSWSPTKREIDVRYDSDIQISKTRNGNRVTFNAKTVRFSLWDGYIDWIAPQVVLQEKTATGWKNVTGMRYGRGAVASATVTAKPGKQYRVSVTEAEQVWGSVKAVTS